MNNNLDIEIYEFLDLMSFTLSTSFMDKWKFKYGERIVKLYQVKLLDSLKNSKCIKIASLFKFLTKDSGFSTEVVKNFLEDVDFSLYTPILQGTEKDLRKAIDECQQQEYSRR